MVVTIAPLEEEPEPADAFEDAPGPYMIGCLLKNCWNLAEKRELGSRYGLCLKCVVLLTCLRSPLHFG